MTAIRSVVILTVLLTLGTGVPDIVMAANDAAISPYGPSHVKTWYYYAVNDINANVPPVVMARYADYVEDDGDEGRHAQAFKAAGGRYTAAYLNPAYVPYCYPPFSPPAGRCEGGVGKLARGESAWFHGRDGTRVRRYMDEHFHYQEALNPLSAEARRAWRQTTADALRHNPTLDIIFADEAGGPLRSGDMSPQSSEFYNFNDAGVEITSDEVFRDAWLAYITEAVRPLIINGNDPASGLPAYDGAFLRSPRVLGASHEGCFRSDGKVETDARDNWRHDSDSLLANTALHKLAVCFMLGTPTPPTRLYALASWWITYDPQWSVAAPIYPIPGQSAVVPEFSIVPEFPLRTAARTVRELRAPSGAYVREFRACYQDGRLIGGCAAVVNPTAAEVALPALAQRYGRALALTPDDVLHGGRAFWTSAAPARLAPATSAILLR